jgi:hypothetical protein
MKYLQQNNEIIEGKIISEDTYKLIFEQKNTKKLIQILKPFVGIVIFDSFEECYFFYLNSRREFIQKLNEYILNYKTDITNFKKKYKSKI